MNPATGTRGVHGVPASHIELPPGPWPTLLAFFCARFVEVDAGQWRLRFARGEICNAAGQALDADAPYLAGQRLRYFREVPGEDATPLELPILHRDAHLVVIDKPHDLAVMPAGRYLLQTALVQLQRQLGVDDLAPLHRLDRGTAGVLMFSACPATRGRYQALFAQQRIHKHYEAVAPALPGATTAWTRRSRLVRGTPFFRTQEVPGEPNSETRFEIVRREAELALYRLQPRSGRKHQLRVHMAATGAPILHDPLYPEIRDLVPAQPLQLLARRVAFDDPLSGAPRCFESRRSLLL